MIKKRKYITKRKSQKQRQKQILTNILLMTGMFAAFVGWRLAAYTGKISHGHASVAVGADTVSGAYPDSTASIKNKKEDSVGADAVNNMPAADGEGTDAVDNMPVMGGAGTDWHLILVNPWNYLPKDYEISLKTLDNGYQVDERCAADLSNMLKDCQDEGFCPVICSAYRTGEKQERLFSNKVKRLMSQGYSEEDARVEAAKVVAVPGTSEHQLGLAVDIVDASNQMLDESQEHTKVQKWLMENSWRYGFILRYPNGKSEITGIIYEPWHYRYVGREAAKEIYEQEVCLEEYLEMKQQ